MWWFVDALVDQLCQSVSMNQLIKPKLGVKADERA